MTGHSNEKFNYEANHLAKLGAASTFFIEISTTSVNIHSLCAKLWEYLIDRNIRHTVGTIQQNIVFNELLQHSSMWYFQSAIELDLVDIKWPKLGCPIQQIFGNNGEVNIGNNVCMINYIIDIIGY